jgi:TetR/AcrR family transcriptional regulator, regulator of cefoperazone and chloramphenicol sensitivity
MQPHESSRPDALTDKGERARARLLSEAGRIFAEKGYAKASTREICLAAGLNVAAIHYHFGGKEGLYRAVLEGPIQAIAGQLAGFDAPGLTLAESMTRLLGPFIGEDGGEHPPGADEGLRLYLREMVEPTPVFAEAAADHLGPLHNAMARLLARHMGQAPEHRPDEDVHRLVFGLVAMAHDYCMSRHFMNTMAPQLLAGDNPLQRARARLIDWGVALVEHERRRRADESNASTTP